MKTRRIEGINILAGLLVTFGLLLLYIAAQVRNTNAQVQAQPTFTPENSIEKVVDEASAIQGRPVSIAISDLGINNDVIKGVFDNSSGQWTLTLDKVQHAVMTNQPNNQHGLTFMYGHNRKGVFAKLPAISIGTVARVKTENGYEFQYRFTGEQITTPDDASVFSYQGPPILVLQTCTGTFFQNRQLFTFEFIGVERHV